MSTMDGENGWREVKGEEQLLVLYWEGRRKVHKYELLWKNGREDTERQDLHPRSKSGTKNPPSCRQQLHIRPKRRQRGPAASGGLQERTRQKTLREVLPPSPQLRSSRG